MKPPRWIEPRAVELLHDESIAEHGGIEGLRDEGLFESALARAQNLHAYEKVDDIARLAASYAFGLAKNHPSADGNKRTAFIAAALFLRINGKRLAADQADAALTFFSLASGALSEDELAQWIRKHMKKA